MTGGRLGRPPVSPPGPRAAAAEEEALSWVTPDDFLVKLAPADPGQRLGAFLIDFFIVFVVTALVLVGALAAAAVLRFTSEDASSFAMSIFILAYFALWNGYWVFFEWRWMGMTPGKRMTGIQVIRPEAGALTFTSALVRNLAREVEVWMPLRLIILKEAAILDGHTVFMWTFLLLAVPLFDRKRRRLGDFIAGTCVVRRPPWPELERDIAAPAAAASETGEGPFRFTTPMLEVYGTAQLNALQAVLSGGGQGMGDRKTLAEIKDNVVRKIGYPENVADGESREFLLAFYKAMRRCLEGQLASGRSTLKTLKKSSTSAKGKTRWLKQFEPPE